jgi:hypothetical protein
MASRTSSDNQEIENKRPVRPKSPEILTSPASSVALVVRAWGDDWLHHKRNEKAKCIVDGKKRGK